MGKNTPQKKVLLIPTRLHEAIKKITNNPTHHRHLEKLVSYTYNSYLHNNLSFNEPIERSKKHFRKQCGSEAYERLGLLLKSGILVKVRNHRNFADSPENNRCCAYQFDPEYLDTSELHLLTTTFKEGKRIKQRDKISVATRKALKKLALPFNRRCVEKAKTEIEYVVNKHITRYTVLDRCGIGDQIPDGNYHVGYLNPHQKDRFKDLVRLKVLSERADREGKQVILYRNGGNSKCFVEHLEHFIERKLNDLRASYANSLLKIHFIKGKNQKGNNNLYCSRSDSNNRLNHNLTNTRSSALSIMYLQGEKMVGIDLSNSQFTILGRLIETLSEAIKGEGIGHEGQRANNAFMDILENYTEYYSALRGAFTKCGDQNGILKNDMKQFICETKNGRFYECYGRLIFEDYKHLTSCTSFDRLPQNSGGTELFKKIRSDAKLTMFATLFSKPGFKGKSKQTLKKHFPSLVAFCDTFKKLMGAQYQSAEQNIPTPKKAGNAALPVMLQKIEAVIFIDNIYLKLIKNGYTTLTKHDSILCKESDSKAVRAIVISELDKFFGSGNYSLKNEWY